jgi:hypothetical protein
MIGGASSPNSVNASAASNKSEQPPGSTSPSSSPCPTHNSPATSTASSSAGRCAAQFNWSENARQLLEILKRSVA